MDHEDGTVLGMGIMEREGKTAQVVWNLCVFTGNTGSPGNPGENGQHGLDAPEVEFFLEGDLDELKIRANQQEQVCRNQGFAKQMGTVSRVYCSKLHF